MPFCSWPVTLKYWENTEILLIWSFFISCLCFMFLESVSRDESQGPTSELLASLQSLGENNDYTLLPHSLHQVCVMVWEHLWRIFQRDFSVSLFSLCARVRLHPQHVPHWALVAPSVWVFGECVSVARYIYKWRANESCGCVYCLKDQLFESVLQWPGSPPPHLCSAHMLIRREVSALCSL